MRVFAALLFLVLCTQARAVIDDTATAQIWKLKYGVPDAQLFLNGVAPTLNTAWLNADDDKDGAKNGDELAAGTNPFSVSKTIKVKSIAKSGTVGSPTVTLSFDTENGKIYRVDTSTDIGNPSAWAPQGSPQVTGDGGAKTLIATFAANKYYRVRVLDTDSDGDGVSDWAEQAVSLNPTVAETNLGTSGTMTALAYVTQQVALPNVVTISAAEPFASEDGPTAGRLMVSRTQDLFPITVNLNVSNTSTAVVGTDYEVTMNSTTTQIFPPSVVFNTRGVLTQDIFVNPKVQASLKGGRSVTTTASPSSSDFPFSPTTATVIINPSTVPTGTGLLARYYDTSSANQFDAANFGQPSGGNFVYTRTTSSPYNGSTILVPTTLGGILVNNMVKLSFNGGALNGSSFDDQVYTVTAVNPGVSFTVGISGATLPTSYSNQTCSFSLQSSPHPAVITRVDPTVNFDWAYGTPNDVSLTPTTVLDNYSTVYEGYLSPTTAGGYRFQLDADDKARVLVDLNNNGTFDLPGEQVVEHGWDTIDGILNPEVVGTFKIGASKALVVPAGAAQRYKIRIEHVETTDSARCRVQWSRDGGTFANIPSTHLFTHASTSSYLSSGGTVTVTTPTAHNLVANTDSATLWFSAGALFGQTANYSGTYPVLTTPTTTTFTVAIAGAPTQASSAAVQWGNAASTTAGMIQSVYANTTFNGGAGSVSVQGAGPNQGNNGIFGAGSPDAALIAKETFSARWTGQVQPQFSEDYTFVVQADDSCALWINGQPQVLKVLPTSNSTGSTYTYNATTGDVVVNYAGLAALANSFVVGETARVDFASGNLSHAPSPSLTYDYDPTNGNIVVDYTNLVATRTPGSYLVGEMVEIDPTSGSLSPLGNLPYPITAVSGNTFTVNAGTLTFTPTTNVASIAAATNCQITTALNHGLATGALVRISGVTGGTFTTAINGLQTITVTGLNTFTVPVECTAAPTAGTGKINALGNINLNDTRDALITAITPTTFTVNIGPSKYADASVGNVSLEIVNKSLKEWSTNGNERYVRIPMVGGVRYDIRLDYYENTQLAKCILSWFSNSQPKQVIPAERLYPASVPQAPPSHVAPTYATALVGGPFSYQVAGSNGATVTVEKPDWLNYDNLTGLLSGTPPTGTSGDYQVIVTTTNSAGTSKSVLNLHVDANAGSVAREYWNGVNGTDVSLIPTATTPSGTTTLTSLDGPTNIGDNYGARIRGYITAPVSGNYYFWIAANNSAELWISNDDEPINAFKRAWLTAGSSTPQNWIVAGQTAQKSAWLALEEGKKYYFEVLHKAGSSGDGVDNLAVGWSKPGESTATPSGVVPGYVLSPYSAPAPGSTPGTLYVATMLPEVGAVPPSPTTPLTGVGSATLRLSEDESYAIMRRTYSGLSGSITSEHIHTDPYLTNPATIVFDIDTPGTAQTTLGGGLQPDGSYKWFILPVGGLSAADIREIIKQGKAYINLHTALNTAGEIRGNFTLANGTRTFTPPPAPPTWADDSNTSNGASRFLAQASFGANPADIANLKSVAATGADATAGIPNSRYNTWIENQFLLGPTQHLPETLAREIADVFGPFDVKISFNSWWKTSMTAPDQLRQRVAYALSQIHVVSGQGPLEDNSRAISYFYDELAANAFGNFKNTLTDTTLTPSMGRYLDMLGNDKPDLAIGRSPNENYAREIKQLFSIGLYRMWPDGTLMLTSTDSPIDTYTQREIVGLAHVFTGWYYGYDGDFRTSFNAPSDWTRQMREVPARHFTGPKRVLNNEVMPGLTSVGGQPLDPYATHLSTQYSDPAYKALPGQEIVTAHDMLVNHPNTGPFICRQLIQRMVTSNPSRDYLYRVVQKFNNNGSGVRGDMKAVVKAILLDYEARSGNQVGIPAYGKQREPVLRVANAARALRPASVTGTYSQTGALNSSGQPYILITTATPHLLETGDNIFLDLTDTTGDPAKPAPPSGTYAVLTNPTPTSTTYAIAAPGWLAGTYTQSGTTITVNMSGHWLPGDNTNVFGGAQNLAPDNEGRAYFDFTSGPLNGFAGFDQTVRTVVTSTAYDIASGVSNTKTLPTVDGNYSGSTFTITAPDSATRSGNVMIARFGGSYSSTGKAGTITIDTNYGGAGTFGTMADHGLLAGDQVFLNFQNTRDSSSGSPTSTENDLVYTIGGVPDANTFTVQARDFPNAAMGSDNRVTVFPLKAQTLIRAGTANARQSTYTLDNTDSDLQQTPLNSPTVFNYFLPDYKYSGTLASQGITTPEFQLTSETTVIRQANFIYNGLFNPDNLTGISSFKSGTNALVLDVSPFMANASNSSGTVGFILGNGALGTGQQTGQRWTSNANLPTLIDRLNTLLMAGQLPANAKTAILKFVGREILSVTTGSPCTFTLKDAVTGSSVPHGLQVGDIVTITGISGGTWNGASSSGNGTFIVNTVPDANTLTLKTNPSTSTTLNCSSTSGLSLTSSTLGIIPYTNSSPSTTNIRDRLRAVVHLILTSPDYTIQR